MISRYYARYANSPTLTTWASYLAKTANYGVLLPLVLLYLDEAEVAVWLLFSTFYSMVNIADMGFSVTFIRVYAYAYGGAKEIVNYKDSATVTNTGSQNWQLAERVNGTTIFIYRLLSLFLVVALMTLGTWALITPVEAIADTSEAWLAWGAVIAGCVSRFYGNIYTAYLQGVGEIPAYRKWEALFAVLETAAAVVAIYVYESLLAVVLVQQVWVLLNVVRNYYLARSVKDGRYKLFKSVGYDKEVMVGVWPSAIRTWIAVLFSTGLTQFSGVVFAQFGETKETANYLLTLRLITVVDQFARGPFYSKIPAISKLYAENKARAMYATVTRGTKIALYSFAVGFFAIGLLGEALLSILPMSAQFSSIEMWILLGFAFFTYRITGILMQWYSVSNDVVAHITNGVSGVLMIATVLMTFAEVQEYSFPLGILASNLMFANVYSVIKCSMVYQLGRARLLKDLFVKPSVVILVSGGLLYLLFKFVIVSI